MDFSGFLDHLAHGQADNKTTSFSELAFDAQRAPMLANDPPAE
jgi:hypothetical protein